MRGGVSVVYSTILEVVREVEHVLSAENNGAPVLLRLKPVDQIRLLKLRTWSLQYYLSVGEILRVLLPVLRKRVLRVRPGSLGVATASLVADSAEKILLQHLAREYPGGEHVAVWKNDEKERQLAREELEDQDGIAVRSAPSLGVLSSVSVKHFVKKYKERVRRQRLQYRRSMLGHGKAYRWSPWR